jgi:DNA-binding beta-propeller fold protein YncE
MRYKDDFSRRALKAVVLVASLAAGGQVSLAQTADYAVYTLPVGDSPASVATGIMFDGKYIWIAIQNPDGGVVEKMSTSGAVLSITGIGDNPDEMAFDGSNVWVTDFTSSQVSVVNSNGNLVNTINLAPSVNPPGPANPEGIVFDGHSVWVADDGPHSNTVTKIDAASQTVVGTYPVGQAPDAMGFDGKNIWVGNSESNNVWLLNPGTGQYVNGFSTNNPFPTYPADMVYDGANMWVANGIAPNVGNGSVSKMRAADGAILGVYTVGNEVRGLAYDGTSIWVCNAASNTVMRLRDTNVVLMGTFATGREPRGVAFDGGKIWISNSNQNTLTIIVPPETKAKAAMSRAQPPLSTTPYATITQTAATPATSVAPWLNFLIEN